MRKPKPSEFDTGDGNGVDHDAYDDKMSEYEDAERDRELEERNERTDEKEHYADYSDQGEHDGK